LWCVINGFAAAPEAALQRIDVWISVNHSL